MQSFNNWKLIFLHAAQGANLAMFNTQLQRSIGSRDFGQNLKKTAITLQIISKIGQNYFPKINVSKSKKSLILKNWIIKITKV